MIKQEDRNIAFITDEHQCLYTLTNSILINKYTRTRVNIKLVFMDIKLETKEIISNIIKNNDLNNVEVIFVDEKNFELGKSLPIHITVVANLRLYLASIFPELSSILYLDADTVVKGDINEIFDYVSYDHHFAVIESTNSKRKNSLVKKNLMDEQKKYVNSGVMFLSLEKMRKENIESKLIDFVNSHTLLYADQDTLNCFLDFEYMPWFYNDGKRTFPKIKNEFYDDDKVHIYHYLMFVKQWDINWPAFTKYKKEKLKVKREWKTYYKKMIEEIQ